MFDRGLRRLYVATGSPGLVQSFDTTDLRLIETIETEEGAHTIGWDPDLRRSGCSRLRRAEHSSMRTRHDVDQRLTSRSYTPLPASLTLSVIFHEPASRPGTVNR